MNANTITSLREMMCKELDEFGKKTEISTSDLEKIDKLVDIVLDLNKIEIYEKDGGYSQAGEWTARMNGNFYDGGRGGMNYNRGNSYYSPMRRYSRDAGDDMYSSLERMYNNAMSDRERQVIAECMDKLR